jgi:hypothetical protein
MTTYSQPLNSRRFAVAEHAHAEVAEVFGALFANSVLAIYDQGRGITVYAPVTDGGAVDVQAAAQLFDDQVTEY